MNPSKILKSTSKLMNKNTQFLKNALIYTREMSRTPHFLPKQKVRRLDSHFDGIMDREKHLRLVLKFKDLILAQPHQCVPISRLNYLAHPLGFSKVESIAYVLKYPSVYEVYEHPVQRVLYLRLTRKALLNMQIEKQALYAQINDAVLRLRKLLMLSNTGRLYLEHLRVSRRDFGFPDDFEYSIVLKYPQYFKMFGDEGDLRRYVELVERDPKLAICAVARVREMEYRMRGRQEENVRFAFLENYPFGYECPRHYKAAMWKWQQLPYWSPYEDISGYDLRPVEAQHRFHKRAVAMIHEILSLTVEKKISLDRLARFRITMDLPTKIRDFILQYPGLFYVSTRGNFGRLHTVFLREAYRRGQLLEPNDLHWARKKMIQLILERKGSEERELASYTRRDDAFSRIAKEHGNGRQRLLGDGIQKQEPNSDMDSGMESGYSDDDDGLCHVKENRASKND